MPDNDSDILRDWINGRSIDDIARERGLLESEVNRVIDLRAAQMFSGEATRRSIALESEKLDAIKAKLYATYMRDGCTVSAALYLKASERLSSLRGWNRPSAHFVEISGHLEPTPTQTSTQKLRSALDNVLGITYQERQLLDRRQLHGDDSAETLVEINRFRAERGKGPLGEDERA